VSISVIFSASEMTYIVSGGALNSTHSLTANFCGQFQLFYIHQQIIADAFVAY